jgi:GNAT superfamily N-acetyltransferase
MALEVATARRSMIPEIARLMDAHFKEDAAFFTRLVGLHWDFGYDEIGSVLTDAGRIVGFFGLHHSRRTVGGTERRFRAMFGVVVDPDYRGRGTSMMTEHALADPDGNYIAWTANPAMDRRYRKMGFQPQNEGAVLVWPGSTALSLAAAPFLRAATPEAFAQAAGPAEAKIFADHRGGLLREHLFTAFGRPLGLITRRIYHRKRHPVSELCHVNDPALLRRVFEPVRLRVHRRERTVALWMNPAETGFRPALAQPAGGAYLYRARDLGPGDFRALYGELLILP